MRVLHIFNEINFSGAEIMYANAAPIFNSHGVTMLALSTGKNFGNFTTQFGEAKIQMFHRPLLESDLNPFFLIKYFRDIIKFIRKENIDVIHIHRSSFFWFFALCGYITGKKTIRTLHNVFKSGKITWIKAYFERLSARKILNVVFQSIGNSVYLNELDYYKNKSTVVNNWFDEKRFYPAKDSLEKASIRTDLGIDKDSFVIITAGRCTEEKGHKDIINALAIINKQIPCVFLHLGCGYMEVEEKELAKALGLESKVVFLGNVVNVRDYLIASDVFVMPSKFEGLGNSAIEAMACQIPNILYDAPGLRDLIKENDNGFLIAQDHRILANSVMDFYVNKNLIIEKGLNALNFVNEHFSIKAGVIGIIKLYGR